MPVGYGIGDHRLFVIDFLIATLIGNAPPKAVLPKARRLNTRLPHCVDKYLIRLKGNLLRHKIFERLGEIHDNKLGQSKAEIAAELDKINDERKDYMLSAEKKCRRVKSGRIPFSHQASIWIRRSQVYRSLLRFHEMSNSTHSICFHVEFRFCTYVLNFVEKGLLDHIF